MDNHYPINRRNFCLALAGAFLLPRRGLSQPPAEAFIAKTYKSARGQTMPYRLFVPEKYDRARRYPLVLYLHGGGGRGNDNLKQITGGNGFIATLWTQPVNQAKYPCFVVAPQCPVNESWSTYDSVAPTAHLRLVLEIIDHLMKAYSIDSQRFYVAGQSMGGFGTFAIISERPSMFAAAVPICGGGDESKADRLTRVAIWAFHGEKDEAVSVERTRNMIAAIRKAGGRPRYTEYKGADHLIWSKVVNEPDLLPWVFAQNGS